MAEVELRWTWSGARLEGFRVQHTRMRHGGHRETEHHFAQGTSIRLPTDDAGLLSDVVITPLLLLPAAVPPPPPLHCLLKRALGKGDLEALRAMATKMAPLRKMVPFEVFYRNKPTWYWPYHELSLGMDLKMLPYTKDFNGHFANPINGCLKGLFFSARPNFDGTLPRDSAFGEQRIIYTAWQLLSPKARLYFADFYCLKHVHYVTLVIAQPGSPADAFCQRHLLEVDKWRNPFLSVEVSPQGVPNFWVQIGSGARDKIYVEVFFTEHLRAKEAVAWELTETIGAGESRFGGLPNNAACGLCNPSSPFAFESVVVMASQPQHRITARLVDQGSSATSSVPEDPTGPGSQGASSSTSPPQDPCASATPPEASALPLPHFPPSEAQADRASPASTLQLTDDEDAPAACPPRLAARMRRELQRTSASVQPSQATQGGEASGRAEESPGASADAPSWLATERDEASWWTEEAPGSSSQPPSWLAERSRRELGRRAGELARRMGGEEEEPAWLAQRRMSGLAAALRDLGRGDRQ